MSNFHSGYLPTTISVTAALLAVAVLVYTVWIMRRRWRRRSHRFARPQVRVAVTPGELPLPGKIPARRKRISR